MNFVELVLEQFIVPKLKRGMKVRLPEELLNRGYHDIKDPYGYIANIKKGAVGVGSSNHNSGFAYRVEFIERNKKDKVYAKAMSEVCKYYTKYGTNQYAYVDGKLLEDTNKELIIKHNLINQHGMSDEEASSNANTIAKL